MNFKIFTICLYLYSIIVVNGFGSHYRYKLDMGSYRTLCPKNKTCSDGTTHYLCQKVRPCECFEVIPISKDLISIFVAGHNGIRNKVANDFQIANMNLVYWSRELAAMASSFLRKCEVAPDPCFTLGEKSYIVGHNYLFLPRGLGYRWPARVVRRWYFELGYKIHSYKDFHKAQKKSTAMANFSQMIMPVTEFIGCGAAKFCHGHYIVCKYFPPYIKKNFSLLIKEGVPCSNCSLHRLACSFTFNSLCGVDFALDGTERIRIHFYLILIILFLLTLF